MNTNHLNVAFPRHEVAFLFQVHFRQVRGRVHAVRLVNVVEVDGHRQPQMIGTEEVVVQATGRADLSSKFAKNCLHRVEASV